MDMFCSVKNGHAHTEHHDYRVGVSRSVRLQCKGLLSFALLALEQTQNAGGCH